MHVRVSLKLSSCFFILSTEETAVFGHTRKSTNHFPLHFFYYLLIKGKAYEIKTEIMQMTSSSLKF